MIVADNGYINDFDYPVTVQCIVREAQKQQLEPEMVWAILRQENGRVNKHSVNSNKTVDIGPMQINNGKMERYIRDLQSKTTMTYEQFKHRLYTDACFNVSVGAYVLRTKINAAGSNFKGMGWYNSANEPHYSKYLASVKTHYKNIKTSTADQQAIAEAKARLYAPEYKIQPKGKSKKNGKSKRLPQAVAWNVQGGFYPLPPSIKIPKSQMVYRR